MGHHKGNPEREVHRDTGLPKKDRKTINELTLHLQEVEEQQQTKPRMSRRKEITKIRAELETKRTIQKISNSMRCFFEKINKINKPLIRFIKKKRGKTQINKIRNERGEITTDTTKIQRIIRNYYKQTKKKPSAQLNKTSAK